MSPFLYSRACNQPTITFFKHETAVMLPRRPFHLTICAFLLLLSGVSRQVEASIWSSIRRPSLKSKSWSSMLTVDPSQIVSTMMRHGGLLVSKSIDKDLKLLSKFCHAEKTDLNVVEKRLVIHNFTIQSGKKNEEALRIGRIALTWDSYRHPCVEVEVEDVFVLVDFFNILLTRNNWSELSKQGFPPTFEDATSDNGTSDEIDESTFLRIGSILLAGDLVVQLHSRPMGKDLTTLSFGLNKIEPLERKIRTKAEENLATIGRRGCSTTEVYSMIQSYFGKLIQKSLADTVGDLVADGGKETWGKLAIFKSKTKDSIRHYVDEAGEWSGHEMGKKLTDRLEIWGESLERVEQEHKPILDVAKRFGVSKWKDLKTRFLEQEDVEAESSDS